MRNVMRGAAPSCFVINFISFGRKNNDDYKVRRADCWQTVGNVPTTLTVGESAEPLYPYTPAHYYQRISSQTICYFDDRQSMKMNGLKNLEIRGFYLYQSQQKFLQNRFHA